MDPTRLWDDTRPATHAPLTEDAVAEAQRLLGVTLPADLLTLLRHRNGGIVADAFAAFPTDRPTSWAPDHVPFDELFGIGHRDGSLSLLDTPYLVAEWDLPSPVVLLSGDGHWWIALDYRTGGPSAEPSVAWLDAEDGTDFTLAPDLRTFLERLTAAQSFDIDIDIGID
ncbi:SMI1/KNR4 family protein [Kitasatospora sp. NPDC059646]|uniref:SMI1/KNR4 family protein n=1 Tax=Kitasatospora sp. NPDC059646 TaxID=3346893 RepID=UPI0036B65F29